MADDRMSHRVYLLEAPHPFTGVALDQNGTLALFYQGQGMAIDLPPEQLLKLADVALRAATVPVADEGAFNLFRSDVARTA